MNKQRFINKADDRTLIDFLLDVKKESRYSYSALK